MLNRTRVEISCGALLCLALCGCPTGGSGDGSNVAPVAEDQSVDVMIDVPELVTLVATDADAGPQPLTYQIETPPSRGTLSAVTGNQVTYTPDPMFSGLDRFTFSAFDGVATSNVAEVCIEVTATPQPGSSNDCSSVGGGGGSGGGGGNGGGGGGERDPILTVDFSASPRANYGRVVGFVDKGVVNRLDSESHITAWDFTANYLPTGTSRFVGAFPVGTEITLVADESSDIGTRPGAFDPDAPIVPAQFTEWEGDLQDTTVGGDKGVLFFTMESDRTVIARFDDKSPLIVRTDGGADGAGTLLDYEFLFQQPLTIPPVESGNADNINIVGTGLTGQAGLIQLYGWFNDVTQLRLCVPANERFTSWSGAGAIEGRCVTVTFGDGVELLLRWP